MEIQKQRDRESQRHGGGGETNRAPRSRERHGAESGVVWDVLRGKGREWLFPGGGWSVKLHCPGLMLGVEQNVHLRAPIA